MADENELLERALIHHQSGRLQEAAQAYRLVLRANPEQPDALYLLGCLAQQTQDYTAARDLIQSAIALAPRQAEYHHALGLALSGLQDYAGAARSQECALALMPQHLGAATALARACYELGCKQNGLEEFSAARNCFRRAVELQPDWLEARHNLARALYELGYVSQAFAEFKRCSEMQRQGSEQSRAMMAVIVPGVPEVDNAEILATRRSWADRALAGAATGTKHASRHSPLRVGYISSFFHRDNWMKPVWGLISQHAREAVQVHLFSDCAASAIRHGYRPHAEDRFFDTSELSNDNLAALVETCGIDVLIDLNGYSNMRRLPLFTRRLAPVVIGWFNLYATTGMAGFDYLIGDSEVVRPEEERFFSEKILRVPGSYLTFDVKYPVPAIGARQAAGRGIAFGALASQYKITDQVIDAWCKILQQTPASSLLIKNRQLKSSSVREDLAARFQKHGIAADRLRLEGPEEHFTFLKAYERIDVALDTFPYNGGTTTTEAIWQGVPVISFYGDRWAARTSASILRAGGLSEFVAPDLKGYIELAVTLANKPKTLENLADSRLGMREKLMASAVCDTLAFARNMERLYAGAYQERK